MSHWYPAHAGAGPVLFVVLPPNPQTYDRRDSRSILVDRAGRPDRAFSNKRLAPLNAQDEGRFVIAYALAKIARYRDIVQRDRSQI